MEDSIFGLPEAESPPDFTLVLIADILDDDGEDTLHVFVTKYHGDDVNEVCELALGELGDYLINQECNVDDVFVAAVFKGDCEPIFPEQDAEEVDLLTSC